MERANIRAYVPLSGAGKARPYFSKELFAYDPERDLYRCPAGETLLPRTKNKARRLSVYKANAGTCEACELRPRCTENKTGRQVLRYFDEAYVDRVRAYRGTFPYEKALRKRRVWVEPLFAEAKDRHGLRRFRLRRLEKVNKETLLVASGQNVKRLLTFGHRHPRKKAQAAALRPPSRPTLYAAHARQRLFSAAKTPPSRRSATRAWQAKSRTFTNDGSHGCPPWLQLPYFWMIQEPLVMCRILPLGVMPLQPSEERWEMDVRVRGGKEVLK